MSPSTHSLASSSPHPLIPLIPMFPFHVPLPCSPPHPPICPPPHSPSPLHVPILLILTSPIFLIPMFPSTCSLLHPPHPYTFPS
ncbi:hypothetical protein V8E53_015861 [Lactarius tabidus]